MKDKTKNIIRETLEWTASIALFGTFGFALKGMAVKGKDKIELDLEKAKLKVKLCEACYRMDELVRKMREDIDNNKQRSNVTIN